MCLLQGKTEVAKRIAKLFHALGLLATNKLVIKSALDLCSGFVGQSKDKVQEVMDEALGGVLFIDEAYNLGSRNGSGGSFGQEVQDKLLQMLTEDRYKHKMVVVIAGYKEKMDEMFLSNAGFKSRFEKVINFSSWDNERLSRLIINTSKSSKPAYQFYDDENAASLMQDGLETIRTNDEVSWANARDALGLFNRICTAQLVRLSDGQTSAASAVITRRDVQEGVREFCKARPAVMRPRYVSCSNCHGRHSADRCIEQCGNELCFLDDSPHVPRDCPLSRSVHVSAAANTQTAVDVTAAAKTTRLQLCKETTVLTATSPLPSPLPVAVSKLERAAVHDTDARLAELQLQLAGIRDLAEQASVREEMQRAERLRAELLEAAQREAAERIKMAEAARLLEAERNEAVRFALEKQLAEARARAEEVCTCGDGCDVGDLW